MVNFRSFSGPYFPAFGLNTEISLRIMSECGKIQTGKTPNTDTFQAVRKSSVKYSSLPYFKPMFQFYSPLKTWDNKRFSGSIEMEYWLKMV